MAPSVFLTPGHVAKAQLHPGQTLSEQVNYLTWFLSTDQKSGCYLGHIRLWNFLQSSSDEKWDEGGPGTDSRGHGCPVKSTTSTKPASDYQVRHVTKLSHDSSGEERWKLAVETRQGNKHSSDLSVTNKSTSQVLLCVLTVCVKWKISYKTKWNG